MERTLQQKRAVRLGLEERAVCADWEKPATTHDGVIGPAPDPGEIQLSIAISLKRIADAWGKGE